MRTMIFVVAAMASAIMLSACGETRAEVGYVPTEEEVLSYEGSSLFGEFYAAEAETFATWVEIRDGQRQMFAAGYREDGTVLLLSASLDSSALQNFPADRWEQYSELLGIPSSE